jgi:hypothetical protein
MRVSAGRNPELPAVTVSYSSSGGAFNDAPFQHNGLLLRSAVCHNGQSHLVVEVSGDSFRKCRLLFALIPRTIEILATPFQRRNDLSLFVFEPDACSMSSSAARSFCGEADCPEDLPLLEISDHSFSHCHSLTSFCIPSHIEIISEHCFEGCKSLRIVTFETNSELIEIRSQAFADCFALDSILIPRSVRLFCSYCFESCRSLQTVALELSPWHSHTAIRFAGLIFHR